MKKLYFILLLAVFIKSSPIFAQLNNGGQHAFFGIDGDTRSNYIKYGPSTGLISSDDWFSFSPAIKNVIDTANASYYRTLLQAGANIGFSQRMSAPLYAKFSGKLWLDAAYGRDWLATAPLTDSTAFTIACKNGDNPANWVGGATNFPDKNDLIDVFAHMRRDGITVYDSLWLFTGTSTVGVVGSRYFDIELYKKTLNYTGMNPGVFSTSGTDAGHTQWIFDASGNITQTGDMILAVSYNPGAAPVVDVRIWVSTATFATVIESVLGSPDIPEVTMTSPTAPGVTHRWSNVWAYADEVATARIYAGFHYRFSSRVGQDMGRKIGRHVMQNLMQPTSLATSR